jgi:prevent-host-death family protein
MEPVWQLQEAKARFSELFQKVLDQGPQRVTRRNRDAVVIVPAAAWDRANRGKTGGNLAQFLAASPLAGSRLNVRRNPSRSRRVAL